MSEPIEVRLALRLIEMALEDESKATPGPWTHESHGWMIGPGNVAVCRTYDTPEGRDPREQNAALVSIARATMRQMLLMVKTLFGSINRKEIRQYHADYEVCAALRDHYDRVRPDWRTK